MNEREIFNNFGVIKYFRTRNSRKHEFLVCAWGLPRLLECGCRKLIGIGRSLSPIAPKRLALGAVFRERLDWPEFWAQSRDPKTFRIWSEGEPEQVLSVWWTQLWRENAENQPAVPDAEGDGGWVEKSLCGPRKKVFPRQNKTQSDGEKKSPI